MINLTFKEILNKEGVEYIEKGNELNCKCPFHKGGNERTPSMWLNEQNKLFYCFGCGVKGNILTFLKMYYGLENNKALSILLEQKYGIKYSTGRDTKYNYILETNKAFLKYCEKNKLDYHKKRGITDEMFSKYELGYTNNRIDIKELFNNYVDKISYKQFAEGIKKSGIVNEKGFFVYKNRLIIPIYDINGRLVGIAGRALNDEQQPKYINSASNEVYNKKYIMYGEDKIDGRKRNIYILEGYLDVIASKEILGKEALSVNGTAFNQRHIDKLNLFNNKHNIVLTYDDDEAGKEGIIRTIKILFENEEKLKHNYECFNRRLLKEKNKQLGDIKDFGDFLNIGNNYGINLDEYVYSIEDFLFEYFGGIIKDRQKIKKILLELYSSNVYRKEMFLNYLNNLSGLTSKTKLLKSLLDELLKKMKSNNKNVNKRLMDLDEEKKNIFAISFSLYGGVFDEKLYKYILSDFDRLFNQYLELKEIGINKVIQLIFFDKIKKLEGFLEVLRLNIKEDLTKKPQILDMYIEEYKNLVSNDKAIQYKKGFYNMLKRLKEQIKSVKSNLLINGNKLNTINGNIEYKITLNKSQIISIQKIIDGIIK